MWNFHYYCYKKGNSVDSRIIATKVPENLTEVSKIRKYHQQQPTNNNYKIISHHTSHHTPQPPLVGVKVTSNYRCSYIFKRRTGKHLEAPSCGHLELGEGNCNYLISFLKIQSRRCQIPAVIPLQNDTKLMQC